MINKKEFRRLKRKYFFQRYYAKFFQKNIPLNIEKKFNRIPLSFLVNFNVKDYLFVNSDIEGDIEQGKFDNALEHFILYGFDEVKRGERRIGNAFPFMTEEDYRSVNPDLEAAMERGALSSFFDHFIYFGYQEFLNGTRKLNGHYPFATDAKWINTLKNSFNEVEYLDNNTDAKEMLHSGIVNSAWDHFVKYGLNEMRKGKRKIHPSLPLLSEMDYINSSPDIIHALNTHSIHSAFEHLMTKGYHEILQGTRFVPGMHTYVYYEPQNRDASLAEIQAFQYRPLVSIILTIRSAELAWLKDTLVSIQAQWYDLWEICIVYDKTLSDDFEAYIEALNTENIHKVYINDKMEASSTKNSALSVVQGEYIALMESGDSLTPDALYEVSKSLQNNEAKFIYSDEDIIDNSGNYTEPQFKPDYSPDLLLCKNYIQNFTVIKKSLIEKTGAWSAGLEGSENHDLYLKAVECTNHIKHIPKVLYHQRKKTEQTDSNKRTLNVIESALRRRKLKAVVTTDDERHRCKIEYTLLHKPLVSIIIPFKDKPELLEMCIGSILSKSSYKNFEIIGMSNNSKEAETFSMMKALEAKDRRVKFYEYNHPFNYSAINNYAVKHYAKGEHIILLNNDIEIITPEWIEAMLSYSQRDDVGVVGAKLYYPNETIQHAGVVIGIGNTAGHAHKHAERDAAGYLDRLQYVQNVSAVTAACFMVKKEIFDSLNGLNEKDFKVAFNDVDFCLRVREQGYLNIFTPYCEAYHHESISRGYEDTAEKIKRFREETGHLRTKHPEIYEKGDPYYNPNLTLTAEDFSFAPSVTLSKNRFTGKPFKETIIDISPLGEKKHDKVCVFSHYDKDDLIDEYVVYYLRSLSSFFDILFVSTASGLSRKELQKIAPYCMQTIVKENYGYDFAAWKSGMDSLGENLEKYDWLLLCNDSVYGPFSDMKNVLQPLDDKSCDIFALSENYEIQYHLQSYFIAYRKNVFSSKVFKHFWSHFKIYEDKATLIEKCEIGFAQRLMKESDYKVKVLAKRYDNTFTNIIQFYWKELIKDGFPFIKIQLLKDNPLKLDIKKWPIIIRKNSSYPVKLIANHLKRLNK